MKRKNSYTGLLAMSLRNLVNHKLRLVAMTLSIILGVGLLTGTYVLGDSFNATFDQIFGTATKQISVVIRSQAVGASESATAPRTAVPGSLLKQVATLPGVARAEGSVIGYSQFVTSGHRLIGSFGSPNVGMSVGPSTSLGSMQIVNGHFPKGPHQVVMDLATYLHYHFHLNQEVDVAFRATAHHFRIVGVVTLGGSSYLAGATIAGFTLTTAQDDMGIPNSFSEIDLTKKSTISAQALISEVKASIGPNYEVLTGSDLASSTAQSLSQGLSFLPWTLAIFALIALFLGSLIVFNTFSLVTAQRSWEMTLYRCLGACRAQILFVVIGEAMLIGLVSSIIGIIWGIFAAGSLLPRIVSFGGIYLPSSVTSVTLRTILIPLFMGLLATFIAAVVPALRTSRLSPASALRNDLESAIGKFTWRRILAAAVLLAIGLLMLLASPSFTQDSWRISIDGVGGFLLLFGVALCSPVLVLVIVRAFSTITTLHRGMTVSLAMRNALRNPRRTAGTAAALMIGLSLISIVAILASSVQKSAINGIEGSVRADFVLITPNVEPFTPDALSGLGSASAIETTTSASVGTISVGGALKKVYGIDPKTWTQLVRTTVISGNLENLYNGGFAVSASAARQYGWKVGEVIALVLNGSTQVRIPLRAIYADNFLDGDFLIGPETFANNILDQGIQFSLVKFRPGINQSLARRQLQSALKEYPQIQVLDKSQFRSYVNRDVNLLVALMSALVLQAVAVAMFGIVNSMSLSVFERTRELGLLRTIGSTRRQLRVMVYWESLIVVGIGSVFGLIVGGVVSLASVRILRPLGVTSFSMPYGLLLGYLGVACVFGIAASLWPAARASAITLVKAIAITG